MEKHNPLISAFLIFSILGFISCQKPQDETGRELRLVSWNCDNFQLSLDTLHQAAAFLNAWEPDIICLQERPHTNLVAYDSIKSCFGAYPYKATNGREDENLNIAIFSKYPLHDVKTWYFCDTYNKMIQADVDWEGTVFRLYNVHLQTTGHGVGLLDNARRRSNQSDLLRREIAQCPYPVIVCGDFNDIAWSYSVRNLKEVLQDLSSSWTGSYQPLGSIFKIDYVLGSPEWERKEYELFSDSWSDHRIQYCELSYPCSVPLR